MMGATLAERFRRVAEWLPMTRGVCSPLSRLKLTFAAFSPLLARCLFGREFSIRVVGSSHKTYLRTRSTDRLVFHQIFMERQYDLDFGIESPSLIVDAGANVGLASIFFALRYPMAQIVAIEFAPQNAELLDRNIAGFGNRVVTKRAALWFESAEMTIRDPGGGEWSFRAEPRADGIPDAGTTTIQVATTTIEELVVEHGPIDILKLDIEGAERDVLQGAAEWIHQVGAVVAELHGYIHEDVVDVFDAATTDMPHRRCHGDLVVAHR